MSLNKQVELVANRSEVDFLRRDCIGERVEIAADIRRRNTFQPYSTSRAPIGEVARRPGVAAARMRIADGGVDEFFPGEPRGGTRLQDQRWRRDFTLCRRRAANNDRYMVLRQFAIHRPLLNSANRFLDGPCA